jgi:arabinan endo-1,5-alpha-L-arabinosidase
MASRTALWVACALPLVLFGCLCGCQRSIDIVASASAPDAAAADTLLDSGQTDIPDVRPDGDSSPDAVATTPLDSGPSEGRPDGDSSPDVVLGVLSIGGDISLADPTMFRWQNTYWIFSTGTSGAGLDVHSSADLKTFKQERPIFSSNPSWVADVAEKQSIVTNLWSPCVLIWNQTIHLYFAASWYSAKRACIGHATMKSSEQQFQFVDDQAPLICSNLTGSDTFTAIDPAVILDAAGAPWMVFGSWGSGIQIIALDADGKRLDPGSSPIPVATRPPPDSSAIQAAALFRWRDDYYLFASFDGMTSHILRVGRAKQVTGPYLDRDGKSMTEGGGTLVLKGDSYFKGPGSNMIFDDGSQLLNVYHAYDQNGVAELRIAQLVFDDDGWPISGGP